jgi:formylglycine-generating enzyme required for sulfatase activity
MEDAGYRQRELWTAPGWDWISATRRMNPDYWETDRWTRIEELPVVGVSRHEAHAFCNWLSKASGLPYRLPTEDEWEKAARGTDSRIYPWGNSFDPTLCNMRQNSLELTTPIGQYSPGGDSPHGCCDMAGNVSEWTASRFESYPFRPDSPGHDRAASVEYVLRGGSWHSHALRVRTTARGMNDPWFTDDDVGFRLALSP